MSKKSGFTLIEILLVVLVIGLLAAIGWVVYNAQTTSTPSSLVSEPTATKDPNEGYLVLKEWGLRFKVPAGLTDVEHQIVDDKVAFYARLSDQNVTYRQDYKALTDDEHKTPKYALGLLIRSTKPTEQRPDGTTIDGKKLGDHYYYTWHSFSGLATGAGALGLYFDETCIEDSRDVSCDQLMEAEAKAFQLVNQESGLLRSIKLVQ